MININYKISIIYSESLFELSISNNKLNLMFSDICKLEKIYYFTKIFIILFNNEYYSKINKNILKILLKIFKKNLIIKNFLNIIYEKHHIYFLNDIIKKFKDKYFKYYKIYFGIIKTYFSIDKYQKKKIEYKLLNFLNYNKIYLQNKIEKKLIAGFLIEINNLIIDGSFCKKLNNIFFI